VECAGNGRSYFSSQQGQTVAGTAWRLGSGGAGPASPDAARAGSAGTWTGARRRRARTSYRARATDERGDTRPDVVPFDSLGYLFGGVVEHPVTAV
jgi:hypothetical protein